MMTASVVTVIVVIPVRTYQAFVGLVRPSFRYNTRPVTISATRMGGRLWSLQSRSCRGTASGLRSSERRSKCLEQVGERFGHGFDVRSGPIGGDAIDRYGTALPDETLEACHDVSMRCFSARRAARSGTWPTPRSAPNRASSGFGASSGCSPTSVRPSRTPRSMQRAR